MKSFRGTLIFFVIVAAIVGFAISEFKKGEKEKEEEIVATHAIKNLEAAKITSINVHSGALKYLIEQKDGKWFVAEPFQDRGDSAAANSFAIDVGQISLESVETDGQVDWAKYGLENPTATITLKFSDGQETSLKFGSVRTYSDGYYVRRNNENVLYVAPKSAEAQLEKVADDFRTKSITFPEGEWDALKITSQRKEQKSQVALTRKEGSWVLDGNTSALLQESAIQDYKNTLMNLKAANVASPDKKPKLVQQFKLSSPELKIQVSAAGKTVEIAFSAPENDSVYFMATDNAVIYKVPSRDMEALFKAEKDFRNKKFPFEFDIAKVHQVRLKSAKTKANLVFRKEGIEWSGETLKPGEKVKSSALDEIVATLKALEIRDFPGKKGISGLDNEIELNDMAGASLLKLNFGKSYKVRDNEFYLAKTQASDELFGIGKVELDEMITKQVTSAEAEETKKEEKKNP